MKSFFVVKIRIVFFISILGSTLFLISIKAFSEESDNGIYEAFYNGELSYQGRLRYESVSQDNDLKNATAYTLRNLISYKTDFYKNFSLNTAIENVMRFGGGSYNSFTNNKNNYSSIADAENTDIQQLYIDYLLNDNHLFRLGRQELSLGPSTNRFVSSSPWRQNHQAFDAVYYQGSFNDLTVRAAVIDKVNSVFGRNRDDFPFSNGRLDVNGKLINMESKRFDPLSIQAYSYLLHYPDIPVNSTQTYGVRFHGEHSVTHDYLAIWSAEYANQQAYKNGSNDSNNYFRADFSLKWPSIQFLVGTEILEGDGRSRFLTPLATAHPFHGWTDQFQPAPLKGLIDRHIKVIKDFNVVQIFTAFYSFKTQSGGVDIGDEFNIGVDKNINKNLSLGAKYARLKVDNSYLELVDTTKFWLFVNLNY